MSNFTPTTPPTAGPQHIRMRRNHTRAASTSSLYIDFNATNDFNSSPESVFSNASSASTAQTTPARSPSSARHRRGLSSSGPGPALLPRIRDQDQVVEPALSTPGPKRHTHKRSISSTFNANANAKVPPSASVAYMPYSRPGMMRSVTQPVHSGVATTTSVPTPLSAAFAPDCSLLSPAFSPSAASIVSSRVTSALNSPVTFTSSSRKGAGGHSRSSSSSSVDEATLKKYGYGTYAKISSYLAQSQAQTQGQVPAPVTVTSAAPVTTSHLATPQIFTLPASPPMQAQYSPAYMMTGVSGPAYLPPAASEPLFNEFSFPAASPGLEYQQRQASPPQQIPEYHTMNLLHGLTTPTQSLSLVDSPRPVLGRQSHAHFWFDIRNLRSWTSFSIDELKDMPTLVRLLTIPLPAERVIPQNPIAKARLHPDSESALASALGDIYTPRVNAALAVSQGAEHHLNLYRNPAPAAQFNTGSNTGPPDFLANYPTDTEQTRAGAPRGRMVGLAKSYSRWNSGMRSQSAAQHVEYLKGLSHLQAVMREHSCRYGFIITEIELVCVRAGVDENDSPYFGFLELSTPIRHATSLHPEDLYSHASSVADELAAFNDPATAASSSLFANEDLDRVLNLEQLQLTTSLALYFLLMLCRQHPLPGHPAAHLDIAPRGHIYRAPQSLSDSDTASRSSSRDPNSPDPSPGNGGGQKKSTHLGLDDRDAWIPSPNKMEKRDATRVRGWVWPGDRWSRREAGSSGNGLGHSRVRSRGA